VLTERIEDRGGQRHREQRTALDRLSRASHDRFPLYPGESAWIEYDYTVSDATWGPWYQRAVRLPTKRLSVSLAFPAELDPVVWGMETSMTNDRGGINLLRWLAQLAKPSAKVRIVGVRANHAHNATVLADKRDYARLCRVHDYIRICSIHVDVIEEPHC